VSSGVEFELIDGRELPAAEILRVLTEGYGRPFGAEWFRWKHLDGPWGPSRAIVARDAGGPLGVVFALPWRFRVDGASVGGIRLVDGATTPRAVRRGVFRRIVRELIDPTDGSPSPPIVIATATPEAQAAHIKNGAVAAEPIASSYRPTGYSRASVDTGPAVLEAHAEGPILRGAATAWDGASLRWRTSAASGATYHMARLAQGDADNGVIYRLGPRRSVILTARWGPDRERTTLLRAVARRHRAVAVLSPSGAGSQEPSARPGLRRGRSLLCVWDRTDGDAGATNLGERAAWRLSGLDLEGIV
jgi:hypothetical protein